MAPQRPKAHRQSGWGVVRVVLSRPKQTGKPPLAGAAFVFEGDGVGGGGGQARRVMEALLSQSPLHSQPVHYGAFVFQRTSIR